MGLEEPSYDESTLPTVFGFQTKAPEHPVAYAQVASGVHVSIAGRSFVLTAGHNLCHDGSSRLLPLNHLYPMGARSPIIRSVTAGEGILRTFAAEEPDVGVIELDPACAVYWAGAQRFELDDIIPPHRVLDTDALVLSGYPVAYRKDLGVPMSHGFELVAQVLRAELVRDVRSPFEPPEGRGIHVRVGGSDTLVVSASAGAPAAVGDIVPPTPPHGLSGGPLIAFRGSRRLLCGIARSVHGTDGEKADAMYEWCEPAHEALRLLEAHHDPDVQAAVRDTLARLEIEPRAPEAL